MGLVKVRFKLIQANRKTIHENEVSRGSISKNRRAALNRLETEMRTLKISLSRSKKPPKRSLWVDSNRVIAKSLKIEIWSSA